MSAVDLLSTKKLEVYERLREETLPLDDGDGAVEPWGDPQRLHQKVSGEFYHLRKEVLIAHVFIHGLRDHAWEKSMAKNTIDTLEAKMGKKKKNWNSAWSDILIEPVRYNSRFPDDNHLTDGYHWTPPEWGLWNWIQHDTTLVTVT